VIFALKDDVSILEARLGIRELILLLYRQGDDGNIQAYFSKMDLQWIDSRLVLYSY